MIALVAIGVVLIFVLLGLSKWDSLNKDRQAGKNHRQRWRNSQNQQRPN